MRFFNIKNLNNNFTKCNHNIYVYEDPKLFYKLSKKKSLYYNEIFLEACHLNNQYLVKMFIDNEHKYDVLNIKGGVDIIIVNNNLSLLEIFLKKENFLSNKYRKYIIEKTIFDNGTCKMASLVLEYSHFLLCDSLFCNEFINCRWLYVPLNYLCLKNDIQTIILILKLRNFSLNLDIFGTIFLHICESGKFEIAKIFLDEADHLDPYRCKTCKFEKLIINCFITAAKNNHNNICNSILKKSYLNTSLRTGSLIKNIIQTNNSSVFYTILNDNRLLKGVDNNLMKQTLNIKNNTMTYFLLNDIRSNPLLNICHLLLSSKGLMLNNCFITFLPKEIINKFVEILILIAISI